jgi:hypothetical protein
MTITDRIRELSTLPPRFNTMLEQGLLVVEDKAQREDLCEVACVVSSAAWERWLSLRKPEDNRQEHEWVVFANVMKIAEAEELSLSDRRIATAFCFLHDTCFIKRIMEEEIRKLEREGKTEEAEKMRARKKNERTEHMKGGADNTGNALNELKYLSPKTDAKALFSRPEIKRCVDIVSGHDLWKVDPPEPPPTCDRLRLACLEGDVLWPMHPLGVLADLERPNEQGETKDFSDPAIWHTQLQQSNKTLVEFRSKWKGIPASAFIDSESIFRTGEGWRLYNEWRTRWSLQGA